MGSNFDSDVGSAINDQRLLSEDDVNQFSPSRQKPCTCSVAPLLAVWWLLVVLGIAAAENGGESTLETQHDDVGIVSRESFVWGPGVSIAGRNTPVRYFYVHAVDTRTGHNFTTSPDEGSIVIDYLNEEGHLARVHDETFDRGDGSIAVRYRIFASHKKLFVHVLNSEREHIAASPYMLENVHPEDCFCPVPLDSFKTSYQCPDGGYEQIDSDLSRFGDVNLTASIPETIKRFSDERGGCFAHYSIVSGKLYAKVHGPHTGFRMFSDAFLSSLVRKVKLPDVEFIINLGDYPQENRLHHTLKLPVFSWCGASSHADIVMPTYDVTQATVDSMMRVHQDMISIQQRQDGSNWSDKVAKAFWRGRDSRRDRLQLVRMSKTHSDLLDAQMTNYFFFTEEEKNLGRADYVPFGDFFKYKYQVNVDGTVAAYRFPWLLAGGSAVLKQESKYYEHFYSQLKPWVHYVPVKPDLSDILEKVKWLVDNDDKAQELGRNAVEFTRQNLMPESIFCYYALLLEQYASKLVTPATVRDGMEEVAQPASSCSCETAGTAGDDKKHDEL